MKGIILAGGSGTRLYPITKGVSKQLLPVYDKPMIYYPLSVLMLADIREVLIITTQEDQSSFISLLGNGGDFGISIEYAIQEEPNGLAEAFIIGEKFIDGDDVALVLGDNLFFGESFSAKLKNARKQIEEKGGAVVFGYEVKDPERFGVVGFEGNSRMVTSIEEKPENPKSNYAITGLYFYDHTVANRAKEVLPSPRGELEITDINISYLKDQTLDVEILGRGFAWLDTGTHESMLEASEFVRTIQRQQGMQIAALEEIGYKRGWISHQQLMHLGYMMYKTDYGKYLVHKVGGGKYEG